MDDEGYQVSILKFGSNNISRTEATFSLLVSLLGPEGPSKILEVTLMRPIHGNL